MIFSGVMRPLELVTAEEFEQVVTEVCFPFFVVTVVVQVFLVDDEFEQVVIVVFVPFLVVSVV
jgi:hypothetical protein